jgi:2,5-furandicarboxylate decarboxylase 1
MANDLRSFLRLLENRGQLVRLEREVDPATEAARLMRELERQGKAGLFSRVRNADARLVYNVLGSRESLALAMGVSADQIRSRFRYALEHRVAPMRRDAAPVQEVVHSAPDVDVSRLPLVTHSEKDAGPYITAGLVIARDPQTGARNVSINRMMLVGPSETGIRMMPPQHLGVLHARAEAAGEDLPVVVAIGVHPLDAVAAATSLPAGEDELELAGGLHGEPVPMTRARSVDLDVPAQAEIVIEGVVQAGVRELEGPFGDFLQFYVPQMPNHRLRITAITHRHDPIYQTMVAGSREDVTLLGVSRESQIVAAVERTGAVVADARLGPTILGCTIAIEQRYPGEGRNVGLAALGAYQWLKYCIVVDHDVDVFDLEDVWWAVAARSSPARAITTIEGAPAFPRDEHGVHGSKAIIDATIPFGTWSDYERRRPPGGERLSLDDWLG